jgi:hypothetical protein
MNTKLTIPQRYSFEGYKSAPIIVVKIVCIVTLLEELSSEIISLQKALEKNINNSNIPTSYYKTTDIAKYFSIDPSFLTKRQGGAFQEGIHFFRPSGSKIIRWSIEALEEWMKAPTEMEENDENILDKMFE